VPDFTKEPLSMSGLVLTGTRAAQTPTAEPDPVLAKVLPSPPTSRRFFDPTDTLTLHFEVYASAVASPAGSNAGVQGVETGTLAGVDLITMIRDADGRVRFRLEEQFSDKEMQEQGGAFGYAARLPLADLTPGRYVVRVEAKSTRAPNRVVARDLPFEITASQPSAQ
jgi:hypothetical protein